ncbi:BRO family protein [Mycobacteroides abscessus]|uniref:BRO family protein n=1 Tax=Mycobacteroides abscessus TaxID=36809 RepID=UPI000C267255|nr:BRO family protein [Mycobacteroides abscessus]
MSTVELFTYEDVQHVRVVRDVEGDPEFVAADVCRMLDHSNPSAAVAGLDEDEKGLRNVETPSGTQQMVTVTEAGLYSLIIRSRKPEAKAIKRWITHDVLPAIRRTGTYSRYPAQPTELPSKRQLAQMVIDAEDRADAETRARVEAESRAKALSAAREADAPKVEYVDTFVTDTDLLSFSTVASTCRITEKRLRALLIERGWIYVQTDSRWSESAGKKIERRRYSEKADKKNYFRRVETHDAPRFRASEVMHTLKITPTGARAIARLVANST